MKIDYINDHDGKHRIDKLDKGLRDLGHSLTNSESGANVIIVEHLDGTASDYTKKNRNIPLILRLSAMELYKQKLEGFNWKNVDALVVHGQHLKDYFLERFKFLPKDRVHVIPLCIDTDKFTLRKGGRNNKVAIVSEVHWRKGAQILPQTVSWLKDYEFYHIGKVVNWDAKNYIDWGRLPNYHYQGETGDVNKWLEDKTFLLHCSGTEGMPRAVGEAMSKGIKPFVYEYRGAKEQWNDTWTAVSGLKNDFGETFEKIGQRQFILDNYSIPVVARKFEDLCKSLMAKK